MVESFSNLNGLKRDCNGNPLNRSANSSKQNLFENNSKDAGSSQADILADTLDSLIKLEDLDKISHFIVPNLKILHKMAVLALRIMNLIFNSSQATSEKETLLTLLYGKKEEFDTDENGNERHQGFAELVSIFLKLWFGHFNKSVYNNMHEASAYDIEEISKKDLFLSYGDVFEIFNRYPIYNDLLLLPTPLLYNQFLFFFHNNKSISEANLEMELRATHINNDVNAASGLGVPFLAMNGNSVNNTAAFELFMNSMNVEKHVDVNSDSSFLSNDEKKQLLEEDLFDDNFYNNQNYTNTVLSIPFKVQYHMFQLLQKINFCMFMLISLRLTQHDLTVVDKFAMEAMNGNVQPIRTSKKFKPNANLTASQLQLQNLNKCNNEENCASANGTFRFFELDTKKLIETSGMLDSATASRINSRAIISDGDSYQIFMDEYQSRLYNSMYNGNSVRSIKKIMKGHINILVEFKTQVFVYELEKYSGFGRHSFENKYSENKYSENINEESRILSNVFDLDRVFADIRYLKKSQNINVVNGTEQTLIDKLKIRQLNISKKICLKDDLSKSINIQELIKHYEWFDFVVLFVQFLQKKFFQMNLTRTNHRVLGNELDSKGEDDGSYISNLFNTTHSNSTTVFSTNSNVNSTVTTPMEYFSEPSTPHCDYNYPGSSNSSVGPSSVKPLMSGTGATTPLYRNSSANLISKSVSHQSPGNSLSPHLLSPAMISTGVPNTTTPCKEDGTATDESPVFTQGNVIPATSRRKVSRNLWTNEEESALMQGLKICGPSWSQILELYGTGGLVSEALKNRKDLQLKDKARNWKVWFYSSDIKTIPPYFNKVTGGVERSLTGGYKIKRLMFLNNQSPSQTSQSPGTPGKKKEAAKRKNYKGIASKLEKFLYREEDIDLSMKVKMKYGTNFIISQGMDVDSFNSDLLAEIRELRER